VIATTTRREVILCALVMFGRWHKTTGFRLPGLACSPVIRLTDAHGLSGQWPYQLR
jgi:hypothetical protein